ncbi:hypothetical protein DPMN_084410 [Dreissena polymorpha]|uniref:Uncharacterized protein n=1 Tax=Dreissena polymorpha TaxID=45954 RepID=A0A9D3YAH3_DREPO|nr:hypothetical protein DPMN_084410 [Dreissena polymorpha]
MLEPKRVLPPPPDATRSPKDGYFTLITASLPRDCLNHLKQWTLSYFQRVSLRPQHLWQPRFQCTNFQDCKQGRVVYIVNDKYKKAIEILSIS